MAAWDDLLDVVSADEVEALEGALDKLAAYTPGERGGVDAWGRLLALASVADRMQALVVRLAGYVHDAGVVEAREGLPLEVALGLLGDMTAADRRTLLLVADVLERMPQTARLFFEEGSLSWGQVRAVAYAVGRLDVDERAEVDRAIADRARRGVDDGREDAEDLVVEVDDLVARLRPQDLERRDTRAYQGRFLSVQLGLDGTSRWYAEVDAPMTATMLQAVDTAAARRRQQGRSTLHEADVAKQRSLPGWKRRGRERADALHEICDQYLTGGGQHGPARPSMLLVAHAETVTAGADEPGRLLWGSPHGPVQLSAATIRRLACEADLAIVLEDGTEVVGLASADPKTTTAIRAMVTARDHHCRGPGCRAPIEVIHHVTYPNGPTHVRHQVGLCRPDHHKIHHDGWTLTMTPHGVCTWRRGRRTYVTHPPAERRLEPGDPPDRGDPCEAGRKCRSEADSPGRPAHPPDAGAGSGEDVLPF